MEYSEPTFLYMYVCKLNTRLHIIMSLIYFGEFPLYVI